MYSRKDPCAHHRKNGHGLGRSVDRSAPFLPEQKQDSRDQGPRVANTDPENEIDNRPTPRDRTVQTPDTHTRRDQVSNVDWAKKHHQSTDDESDPPPSWSLPFNDPNNLVGYPRRRPIV
jgi:hypothetical protein